MEEPLTPKDKSFLLCGDNGETEADGEAADACLFAAAACSGVPYFLGLPLFLLTPVSKGEETADGEEL